MTDWEETACDIKPSKITYREPQTRKTDDI